MKLHECAVEITVDDVVYCYLVQIEPWGEYSIHPAAFDVTKDVIAELVAKKADLQKFEASTEYGVWFKRIVNSFHESLIPDGVKHIKHFPKQTHKRNKILVSQTFS